MRILCISKGSHKRKRKKTISIVKFEKCVFCLLKWSAVEIGLNYEIDGIRSTVVSLKWKLQIVFKMMVYRSVVVVAVFPSFFKKRNE